MPVNPQVRALLDEFEKQGLPPFEQMSPTQARLVAMGFRDLQGEPEDVAEVRDILVPGPAGALPVELVYFAYPRQDLAAQSPADANANNYDAPGEPA